MQPRVSSPELPIDPLWYKDAIIYQTHVKAFHDSNGDGFGDFRGLTQKLDYLQDLGITAIWLQPFYPSPLRDDGYDIADYTTVHPSYGKLRDFNRFLKEAHRRGLRVITELVINHTSDHHPWFQRARQAPPGSRERNYYVWSDSDQKYAGTRTIFRDFEPSNWSRDSVANAYYWHRFYSHQPDLNFDSPQLRREIFRMLDLWLGRGVDGLRLDAIPYLYEREGTSNENLPETHAFLKELRRHIDEKWADRMLLAEANQWPEDAVAYFGDGDESHTCFHFPLMPRLFMATRMEDRYPIVEILRQTPPIPDNCQWVTFLRNHDELTLEMVTDQERDYMYQVYARDGEARINLGIRRRLAPLLGNDRRAIELMNSLYFSLPGTPVIYYGDEIGMGDNFFLGDRNGVRTPMQWSSDRNAGFSRANPQRLYLPVIIDPEYHYESVNVEAQENNSRSLLWWFRHLISLRKRFKAFGRGDLEFLHPRNSKILAFVRTYQEERILVVANLSRFAQTVELDLTRFKGAIPVELFGGTRFPPAGDSPYFMTLGRYAFYWFALEPQQVEAPPLVGAPGDQLPTIRAVGIHWETILEGRNRASLESMLPGYMRTRRWFGGKARAIQSTRIVDDIRISHDGKNSHLLLIQVEYSDGSLDTYCLPVTLATGDEAEIIRNQSPGAVLVTVKMSGEEEGILYDAMWDEGFPIVILESFNHRRNYKGDVGELVASSTRALRPILRSAEGQLSPSVSGAEQSNTSVFYGRELFVKLFRRLQPGINPDLEIGRFLTEKARFPHMPPTVGALEYRQPGREPITVAILQAYVENQGDAWQYTLDYLGRYFERALEKAKEVQQIPMPQESLLNALAEEPPLLAKELIGFYLERARLLGQRTAELHLALSSDSGNADFAPEKFAGFYQNSQYQGMRGLASQNLRLLKVHLKDIPEEFQPDAERVLTLEDAILDSFRPIRERRFTAMRTRTHGDYHLGQVLYTGEDFVIIDFEGEPARSISERRTKNSPFKDVAGMLWSFHNASLTASFNLSESPIPMDIKDMEPWRKFWYKWVASEFLRRYLEVAEEAPFVPKDLEELQVLLDLYTLEKVVYELGYELNNRPRRVGIPLQGILHVMETVSK